MSSIKTVGVFAIIGVVAAGALHSDRAPSVEEDRSAIAAINVGIRQVAADFDPKVSLTQRELKDFEVMSIKVARTKFVTFLDSVAGGDTNYDVYVRYREGGVERCLTLGLKRRSGEDDWQTNHNTAVDRCEPAW
jgi:hypothetical protein